MKMKILFATLLLLLAGCGDSTDLQQVGGQQSAVGVAPPELQGFWGGYFPQTNNTEGVEVHFHRNRGFLIRENERPIRQTMEVQRAGNSVTILLASVTNPQDQSSFIGSIVNDTTLSGTFSNDFRGESFPMTLTRHPKSDALTERDGGGVAAREIRPQGVGAQTLQITITDSNDKVYSLYFGLAYYSDATPASWANVPNFEPLDTQGQPPACDVTYLAFYPQWSIFETLVQEGEFAASLMSLEVLETEWASTGYNVSGPLGLGGNSTLTDSNGDPQTVKSFTMQIVPTATEYNLPAYQDPYEPGDTLSYTTKYGTYPNMPTSLYKFLRREYGG